MTSNQPIIYGMPPRKRPFATSAVAVQALIVNEKSEILLLSSPTRNGADEWQLVSGGLDAGETVLDATLREVAEEAGPDVKVRPLGVVHSHTFHYDANVQFMIGVYYLLAYEGGEIVPGDDMIGSRAKWWSLPALENGQITFHASTHLWMIRRAFELYPLWREQTVPLQLPL